MKTGACFVFVAIGLVLSGFVRQAVAGPTLNYQGRITADASEFTGMGQFKFVLMDQSENGLWSNDGTAGAVEPVASVGVPVAGGLFSVELGKEMQEIPPAVFHAQGLRLRVWFSDGSGFERLQPDVAVNPLDFSQLNTGSLLVVDSEGRGDFDNLQDAVDLVARDPAYEAILVMPGFYFGEVVIPEFANRIAIRGVSQASAVQVWSDGPTFTLGMGTEAHIENLSVSGVPAVRDAGMESWGGMVVRACELALSFEQAGSVVEMSGQGNLRLSDCRVQSFGDGPALSVSGGVYVDVAHSTVYSDVSPAVHLSGGYPILTMESCEMWSGEAEALRSEYAEGNALFKLCQFAGGVTFSESSTHARFLNCHVQDTLSLFDMWGGYLFFSGCEFGYQDGVNRVRMVGGNPHAVFKDCRMHAFDATALYFEDAPGYVSFEGCDLQANGAGVIEMVATEEIVWPEYNDEWGVKLRDCTLRAFESQQAGDYAAIRLANASDLLLWLEVEGCDIQGHQQDVIVLDAGCELEVSNSAIEGMRHGIYAPNGADEIEIVNTMVSSEAGDALHVGGPSFVFIRGGDLWGEDAGRGAYLNLGEYGGAIMAHSILGGQGAGLECASGFVHCNHTLVLSGGGAPVALNGPNVRARFNHCVFKSSAEFDDDEEAGPHLSPAVLLNGAQGQTPQPFFFACAFEPSEDATYSVGLDGGASSGGMVMINSVLRKPVQTGIVNAAPAAMDSHGNYVVP